SVRPGPSTGDAGTTGPAVAGGGDFGALASADSLFYTSTVGDAAKALAGAELASEPSHDSNHHHHDHLKTPR
ncbi:MAG: hypothetical protein J0L61_08790, partial [Planctomycetes bacterium]|nr:hypothetical protein [Planctomycetota bacterium]